MALRPTTQDKTNAADDNVSGEEKPDFRAQLIDQLGESRVEELDAQNGVLREDEPEDGSDEEGGEAAPGVQAGDGADGESAAGADDGAEPEPEPEPEPAAAAAQPQDPLVEIEIDGQKYRVPQSQLIESFHGQRAALARMNEANTRIHDQPGAEAQPAQPQNPLDAIDWGGVANSIAVDDPEESGKRLRGMVEEVIRAQAGQAVDRNQLTAQVRADVERKLEWDRAILDLGVNYGDVLSNPKFAALAGAEANRTLQVELMNEANGRGRRPFYQILAEGAESIRQWAKETGLRLEGATADDPPDQNGTQLQPNAVVDDARMQRKQSATARQPTTRVARARPVQQQAQPDANMATDETARSRNAIAEIRAARGQA